MEVVHSNKDGQNQVLVVDDQQHVLDALTMLLESETFSVVTAQSPADALSAVKLREPSLVLMDMNFTLDTTSGKEGLSLVSRLRQEMPLVPIVVMTAWASIELTVEAMRLGADDFVEKPWKNQRLISLINNQLSLYREKRQNQTLKAIIGQSGAGDDVLFRSSAMADVLALIERTAQSDANILLTGESGVGKSMIAKTIHQKSLRADNPFISVNMGALTDTLFAGELFGHVKGAFTDAKTQRVGRFEMAEKGTLFMDEIANIPLEQQAKLLRVLESGEFEALGASRTQTADVRIISATNDDLADSVAAGKFRQDLLYRLNTITIEIPPLRSRGGDITLLAEHFVRRFAGKYRRQDVALSTGAVRALEAYSWPGNVRELAHCIERGVLVCADKQIEAGDLGLGGGAAVASYEQMTLDEAEKLLIQKALQRTNNSVAKASEQLGVSRNALYRRLEKYGIGPDVDAGEA